MIGGSANRQNAVVEALAAGGCHSTCEIAVAVSIPRGHVSTTLCRLVSRGFARRLERGCFELTPEGLAAYKAGEEITSGPRGPLTQSLPRRRRRQTDRERIWNAIRILQKVGVAAIEEITGCGRSVVSRYLNDLERAGYLIQLRPEQAPSSGGVGCRRWSLIDDTGFEAPSIIVRDGTRIAFDRNSLEARPMS